PDTLGGWVHVKSTSLDPDSILTALKDGSYYSSTGPQIHNVEFRDEHIIVECDPAIAIYAGGRGSVRAYKRGDGLTRVELPIAPFLYALCRFWVLAGTGARARTSLSLIDELNIT